MQPPRYFHVETAEPIGPGDTLEKLFLVQVDDRTFRRVTGEELGMLFKRHPREMRRLRDRKPKDIW